MLSVKKTEHISGSVPNDGQFSGLTVNRTPCETTGPGNEEQRDGGDFTEDSSDINRHSSVSFFSTYLFGSL